MKLNTKQLKEIKEEVELKVVKNVFDIYDYKEIYEDLKPEELIVLKMI